MCILPACITHNGAQSSVFCLFCLCTSRSVMTFNLFSRLHLHCSTKHLLGVLPKQYLALTLHFDTFHYVTYVTFCYVTLYVRTVSILHYCTTYQSWILRMINLYVYNKAWTSNYDVSIVNVL